MIPERIISFLDREYSERVLSDMTDEKLMELRNLIADNLELPRVRGEFKDHEVAVAAAWNMLEKFEAAAASEAAGEEAAPVGDGVETAEVEEAGYKKKPRKSQKGVKRGKREGTPKCMGVDIPERITAKHFARYFWTVDKNDAEAMKGKRPNQVEFFEDGGRIIDAMTTEGVNGDLPRWWAKLGAMRIEEISEEQFAQELEAWKTERGLAVAAE